ncbi:hypothetical protein [Streptomyces sp. NPDC003247]|uniref:hypothetical protein n=1 Tax=Streptomyces sp. NPDC003247 TaxID=3364677 RepID=UPI0036B6187A
MPMQNDWRHPLAEKIREQAFRQAYEEGFKEGLIEVRAEGVVWILGFRGIPVSDAVRERVESCYDPDRLALWQDRAMRAEKAEDIFDDRDLTAPPPPHPQ